MSDSEDERHYTLRGNRYFPISDDYSKNASPGLNKYKYVHSNSYISNDTSHSSSRAPYDSSSKKTRRGFNPDGSEMEKLDKEEHSSTQIPDWEKVDWSELLDEYEKLHKKKQRGSADEAKEMRELIDKRIRKLEQKAQLLEKDFSLAKETISDLQEEINNKEKEIKFQAKEAEDQRRMVRYYENRGEPALINRQIEEFLATLQSKIQNNTEDNTEDDKVEEMEKIISNIRLMVANMLISYEETDVDRHGWRMESEKYEEAYQKFEEITTTLETRLKQHEDLINTTFNGFKMELEALKTNPVQQTEYGEVGEIARADAEKTYAKVLKRKSAIVIKSKNTGKTATDIRQVLNKEVNSVPLSKINCHQTKAGNLVLSSHDETVIQKFQEHLERNEEITTDIEIKKITPKRQKIIILNAPHMEVVETENGKHSDEEKREAYLETLLKPALSKILNIDQPDFNLYKIIPLSRTKTVIHLVVDIPREYSSKLINNSTYVGFNNCKIRKFFHTPRCFHCQGLGHIAINCDSEVACAKCAGSHATNDCESLEKGCINCQLHNKDTQQKDKKFNTEHYAFDSNCQTFRLYQRECFNREQ